MWFASPKRKKDFLVSDPVWQIRTVFIHHRDLDFDWDIYADLEGLRVGTTKGYAYIENFRETMAKHGAVTIDSDSDRTNISMLLKRRIDLHPIQLSVARDILRKHFSTDQDSLIVSHPKPLNVNDQVILFPKSLPASHTLVEDFNSGLAQFKQTNEYSELIGEHK